MNERPAKIAVICHMLFTLASLLLAIYFFLFVPGKGIVPMVGLPIWMGYSVYATIKSVADIIGRQRRFTNFSNMIAGGPRQGLGPADLYDGDRRRGKDRRPPAADGALIPFADKRGRAGRRLTAAFDPGPV